MKKIFFLITFVIFFIGIISPIFVFAAEEQPCKNPPKEPVKFFPQITIPGTTLFDKTKSEGEKPEGITIDCNSIAKMVADTYKFIAGTAGIAAVIVMMAGGYIWLFAGGNASKVGEAKSLIGSAVLGLFLVLGSYMILNLINPELIKLKSLDQIAGIKPIPVSQTGNGASVDSSAMIRCPLKFEVSAREKTKKDEGCGTVVPAEETKGSACMRVSCLAGKVCILNMEEGRYSVIGSGCVNKISVLRNGAPKDLSVINDTVAECGWINSNWSGVYSNECGGDSKYTSCAIRTSEGEDIGTTEGGASYKVVKMRCEFDDI